MPCDRVALIIGTLQKCVKMATFIICGPSAVVNEMTGIIMNSRDNYELP